LIKLFTIRSMGRQLYEKTERNAIQRIVDHPFIEDASYDRWETHDAITDPIFASDDCPKRIQVGDTTRFLKLFQMVERKA